MDKPDQTINLSFRIGKKSLMYAFFPIFRMANWTAYKQFTAELFNNMDAANKYMRQRKTSKEPLHQLEEGLSQVDASPILRPNLPTDAANLSNRWDELRSSDPDNTEINMLNKRTYDMAIEYMKGTWRTYKLRSWTWKIQLRNQTENCSLSTYN